MTYKQKLIQFNSTAKYRTEVDLLINLMKPMGGEKILDYGCGLGRTVRQINEFTSANCFGFDVRNYREHDDDHLFRNEYFFKFHKVYFMHSLAHIPDPEKALNDLKELLREDAKIFVITPNKLWLREVESREYVPDPTVISHFSLTSLIELFTSAGYEVTKSGQIGDPINNQLERLFIEAKI